MALAKLIIGPPGSGKTTTLVAYGKKEADAEPCCQRTVYINSVKDTRGGMDVISTHNDTLRVSGETRNIDLIKTSTLLSIADDIMRYDILLIDEGHFFSDLVEFVDKCIWEWNKIVLVAGCASDINALPLGQICELLARATREHSVETLVARCGQCLVEGKRGVDAHGYYAKMVGVDDRVSQVKVGGIATYKASCTAHHPKCKWHLDEEKAYTPTFVQLPLRFDTPIDKID